MSLITTSRDENGTERFYKDGALMDTIHSLKTWPMYFNDLISGVKTFEVRKNDRGFKVGHKLYLVEFDPIANCFTGRKVYKTVTYILEGGVFGIEKGFIVMGLKGGEE